MVRNLAVTAFAALLVIGGYEIFLRVVDPQADIGQDQFATNVIRLENYADRGARAAGVVVGSSLTARVPLDAWPKDWQVLSQAGGNAMIGLEAVDRVFPRPQKLLVEINTLDTAYNRDAVDAALGGTGRFWRKLLWLTRMANRPANLLTWRLRPPGGSGGERPGASYSILLTQQRQAYDAGPAPQLGENLRQAKAVIDRLRSAGVKIIFFEMPVDPSLMNTLRMRRIRQAASDLFPPSFYCHLSFNNGRPWRTIDGIHLLPQDARTASATIVSASCAPSDRIR